jgi:hypothetical protein
MSINRRKPLMLLHAYTRPIRLRAHFEPTASSPAGQRLSRFSMAYFQDWTANWLLRALELYLEARKNQSFWIGTESANRLTVLGKELAVGHRN